MDANQGMAIGTLLTSMMALVGYIVKFNHKRIRSNCCNKPCITSIDVEDTTPVPEIKEESKNESKNESNI